MYIKLTIIFIVYSCIGIANYGKELPDNYFKQNKEVHNCNTRNRNKLHVSYKRTDYRKYTVFSKGISIWNCLDETIRNIKSFFSFKNKVKFYFFFVKIFFFEYTYCFIYVNN